MGIVPNFLVVSPEFQTTHLSSYGNPSNFWVIMPNYFAVNLTSHTRLLQLYSFYNGYFTFQSNDSKVKLFLP